MNTPIDLPETYLPQVADSVGCDNYTDTEDMVDCLRNIDHETLRKTTFDCSVSSIVFMFERERFSI